MQFPRQHLCPHRLTGSRRSVKQHRNTPSIRHFGRKSPGSIDLMCVFNLVAGISKYLFMLRWKNQILPAIRRLDQGCLFSQPVADLMPAGLIQSFFIHFFSFPPCHPDRLPGGIHDLPWLECKFTGKYLHLPFFSQKAIRLGTRIPP